MGGRVMLDRRANECTYDLGCTEMHESRGSDWLGLRHPLPEYPPACFTIKTWSFLFHLPVRYRQPSSSQLGSHLPVLDLILTTLRIISQSTLDLETETIECHLRNKRHSAGSPTSGPFRPNRFQTLCSLDPPLVTLHAHQLDILPLPFPGLTVRQRLSNISQ